MVSLSIQLVIVRMFEQSFNLGESVIFGKEKQLQARM